MAFSPGKIVLGTFGAVSISEPITSRKQISPIYGFLSQASREWDRMRNSRIGARKMEIDGVLRVRCLSPSTREALGRFTSYATADLEAIESARKAIRFQRSSPRNMKAVPAQLSVTDNYHDPRAAFVVHRSVFSNLCVAGDLLVYRESWKVFKIAKDCNLRCYFGVPPEMLRFFSVQAAKKVEEHCQRSTTVFSENSRKVNSIKRMRNRSCLAFFVQ